jgi:hypothetical protein
MQGIRVASVGRRDLTDENVAVLDRHGAVLISVFTEELGQRLGFLQEIPVQQAS